MAAEAIARVGPGGGLDWAAVTGAGAPCAAPLDPSRLYDPAVPAGLGAALDLALADPDVQAVVLDLAAGAAPGAGPFDLLAAEAGFAALAERIAGASKPVVALIAGPVAGPLAALALAAALRVATPGACIGFPEAGLGLVPGAGATQRAARLAGAGPALALLLSGRMLPSTEAQQAGLIEMVTEAALPAARAAAAALAAARQGGAPLPFAPGPGRGLADPAGFLAAVAAARAGLAGELPAPWQIVDCVEAALLLPAPAGLGFERAVFEALAATPEAQALAALAGAEARAFEAAAAAPLPEPVALAGPDAAGIAAELLAGGAAVWLLGPGPEALRAPLEAIAARHAAEVAEGRMTEAARDAAWERLSATTDAAALAACRIGIAAGASEGLAEALPPGALLASLGAALPGAALRLQGHAPQGGWPLLEIATDRAPEALAAGLGLARAMGRLPLPCRPGAGALPGARLLAALRRAAEDLLLLGAAPAEVDAALRGFGLAEGPFEAMDRRGLDRIARQASRAEPSRPGLAAQLAAAGRTGFARRRGFLAWPEGAEHGRDDPGVLALIAEERWVQGLPAPQGFPRAAICQLCLAALANEGARMLTEGVALQAGDLDLLAGAVLGFPRPRGGPMHWAGASGGRTGLLPMRNALKAQASALPGPMAGFWAPDPAWDRLIRAGRRF